MSAGLRIVALKSEENMSEDVMLNAENDWNDDELIDNAYDIFLELASDNLDPADIILFNLQFEDRGAAELVDVATDWGSEMGIPASNDLYAEVVIGLVNEQDEIDDVFARILLNRSKDMKECHIQWKQ
ncbi:dsDNA-mimic protein [Plesiomonas shigelloides]|nr:dsDNA-mimic protein [Plesiomonas shigelloides]